MSTARPLVGILTLSTLALAQVPSDRVAPALPLSAIKWVCVERFVGDPDISTQARELAIASLFTSKLFAVTEKCEKAEATMKGSASRSRGQKSRSEGDSMRFGETASVSDSFGRVASGVVGATDERLSSSETHESASVVLRLVNADGEVIWAHSVDSTGGKTRGAVSDAVDQGVRQLVREVERAKKTAEPAPKR
jgi:hypothetical protein